VLAPIIPARTCGHITSGAITLSVNGAERQRADISDLIHPVGAVIADLSKYYHLAAGDLIYTGTPSGVGALNPGDRVEGAIDKLGRVELTISA
jgi:fumarylpyruvate hydrolase